MSVDMSPEAVSARLDQASRLSGDLSPDRRLDTKIDMSPAGISRRLREASDLLEVCRKLGGRRSISGP